MTESDKNRKMKIEALLSGFSEAGFDHDAKISHPDLVKYLNTHSKSGEFSKIISEKLFQVLSLDASSSIPVEDFISGFLQFEEDIKAQADALNVKLSKEKEVYNKLLEDFKRKSELCKDAKVSGEITDIDIQRDIKGIKELIIKVLFNDKVEEFHFKLGDKDNGEIDKKKFEFKPTSRNDHFEFIMQGVNNKGQTFDIGKKVFPLTNVMFSEEYLVKIEVPEMDDENKVAAFINAKILLFWNDINFETQKRKLELKIKKLKLACKDAADYLKKLKEIYTGIKIKKKEVKKQIRKEVNINVKNKKKKKRRDLDVYYNNIKKEKKQKNFLVEFNNEKKVQSKLNLTLTKEVKEPVPEPKQEEIIPPKPIEVVKPKQEQSIQTNQDFKEVAVNTVEKVIEQKENIHVVNIENNTINTNLEEYPVINNENIMVQENLNQEVHEQPIEEVDINRYTFKAELDNIPFVEEPKLSYEEKIEPVNYDINNLVQQEENIQVNNYQNYEETTPVETFTQEQTYTEPTPIETYTQDQNYTEITQIENYTQEQTYTEPTQISQIQDYSSSSQIQEYTHVNPVQTYTKIHPVKTFTTVSPLKAYTPELETYIPDNQVQIDAQETQIETYTPSTPLETLPIQTYNFDNQVSSYSTYNQVNQTPIETFTPVQTYNTHTQTVPTITPVRTYTTHTQSVPTIPQVPTYTTQTQLVPTITPVRTYTTNTQTVPTITPVRTYTTNTQSVPTITPVRTYTTHTQSVPTITPVRTYTTHTQSVPTIPQVPTYSTQTQSVPTIPQVPKYSTQTQSVPKTSMYSKIGTVQASTIINPNQMKLMQGYNNNRFYRVNLGKNKNPRSRSQQGLRSRFGFSNVRYY